MWLQYSSYAAFHVGDVAFIREVTVTLDFWNAFILFRNTFWSSSNYMDVNYSEFIMVNTLHCNWGYRTTLEKWDEAPEMCMQSGFEPKLIALKFPFL